MHRAGIIAWPTCIPGEQTSDPRFGIWASPSDLMEEGYRPWWVLDSTGSPWAMGLVAKGPAQDLISGLGWEVPVCGLSALEEGLRDALGEKAWRSERFGLLGPQGLRSADPRLCLERSLFRALGLVSESVQLNLQSAEGRWWVGRRAQSKSVDPGLLDACVAGGLAARESPVLALFREAREEAGLSSALVSRARLLGAVRVFRPLVGGLLVERVWTYTVSAPVGLEPTPLDGEVEFFQTLYATEIERAWREGHFNHEAAVASLSFGALVPAE